MGRVREFMEHHYRHFNARETVDASRAYGAHIDAGGKMLMTLAGAMSTAQLGVILARMIREGKVHAICCTGANLEEDVFNLLANKEYEIIKDWRALSAADEKALYDRGMNRVTDTCIPEDVMRHLERRLIERWRDACEKGERRIGRRSRWLVGDNLAPVIWPWRSATRRSRRGGSGPPRPASRATSWWASPAGRRRGGAEQRWHPPGTSSYWSGSGPGSRAAS